MIHMGLRQVWQPNVAVKKARQAGLAIRLIRGFGDAVAEPDASFDRVTSSLMLHQMAVALIGKPHLF